MADFSVKKISDSKEMNPCKRACFAFRPRRLSELRLKLTGHIYLSRMGSPRKILRPKNFFRPISATGCASSTARPIKFCRWPLRLSARRETRNVTAQVDPRPSLSPTSAAFLRAVTIVVRHSGPHSPLCGSESGGAPSARDPHEASQGRGEVRLRVRRRPFRTGDCADHFPRHPRRSCAR